VSPVNAQRTANVSQFPGVFLPQKRQNHKPLPTFDFSPY
jgi:hypothetical protein